MRGLREVRLVLASASPRRRELLAAAGFEFEAFAVDVDETPRTGESPEQYVRRLAAEKSARAQQILEAGLPEIVGADLGVGPTTGDLRVGPAASPQDRSAQDCPIILGADTTVVVDGAILAKPDDDEHARQMLRRLSGRDHQVMTGLSLRRGTDERGRVETTTVVVARLSDADIAWYVATGEGRDKAGAYAIQGLASRFIPRIEGSYSNVVGLPVSAVYELIQELLP